MEILQEELEKLKEKTRQEYNAIKEIYCLYFKETVKFSSDGFQHLFTALVLAVQGYRPTDAKLR